MLSTLLNRGTIFVLILGFLTPSFGAARYIRYETVGAATAGNDANDGSMANPWKRHPDDNNATGNSLAFTPSPGDTFYFYAGANYVGTINLRNSGTPESPITYDGTSWGVPGQRSTNSTGYASGTSAFQTGANVRSNIFLHGFAVEKVGGWPPGHAIFSGAFGSLTTKSFGAGFFFDGPQNSLTISNFYFNGMGHWQNIIQNFGEGPVSGNGVNFDRGGTNNLVIDCTFTRMEIPLAISSGANYHAVSNRFINNIITNSVNWGILMTVDSSGAVFNGNIIKGGRIGDIHEYNGVNWLGAKTNSTGEAIGPPHVNGIALFNNGTGNNALWTNNVIDGVHFWTDLPGDPSNTGGTAAIFSSRGPSITIQNCVFNQYRGPYSISIGYEVNNPAPPQYVWILNNTFNGGNIRINAEPDVNRRHVFIEGNIFRRTGNSRALLAEVEYGVIKSLNGNVWHNTTESQSSWTIAQLVSPSLGGTRNVNLAGLKALGLGAADVFGDPKYVSPGAPYRDSNLTLQDGSSAIGMTFSVTNRNPFDKAGTSRVGKAITAGAFVASSSEPGDTTPPTPNPLTWVIDPHVSDESGTVTMEWSAATDDSGDAVTYTVVETTLNPGCNGDTSLSTTTYVDSGIPPDTSCSYVVYATDSSGNITTGSASRSITTPQVQEQFLSFRAGSVNVSNLAVIIPTVVPPLFYEDAEGFGTPTGWTDSTNTIQWDNASVVFAGTNSVWIPDTTNHVYTTRSFSTATTASFTGWVRRNSVSGTPRKVASLLLDGVEKAGFYFSTNGLGYTHGSTSNHIALATMPSVANTWYAFRVKYVAGSGANGQLHAWWHTNQTYSLSASNSITTGTSTTGVNEFRIEHPAGIPGNVVIMDNILATTLDQGNNPTP